MVNYLKKWLYTTLSLFLLIGGVVVADYYALFGSKVELTVELIASQYRTQDQDTKAVISNVFANCVQKGDDNACNVKPHQQFGITSVIIPIYHEIERSWWFKQSEKVIFKSEDDIHISFIHPDYHNHIESNSVKVLYANRHKTFTIYMKPRQWDI